MIHKMIEIPSEEFVNRYYAFNPDCENMARIFIKDLAGMGLKCFIKEKEMNPEDYFNSVFMEISQILSVTFLDSKNKQKIRNLAGCYSKQERVILLLEESIFNLLGWCLNHTKIVSYKWDTNIQGLWGDEKSIMHKNKRVEHRSLCKVSALDNKNIRWLKRLGDINENGEIITVEFREDAPKTFDNRSHIFWKNGPIEEGFVGIWNWSAVPNKADFDKDYVESCYDPSQNPIEIIEISHADSKELLVEYLKKGVSFMPTCDRVLFACKLTDAGYEAVFCDKNMLDFSSEGVNLKDGIASLETYYFDAQSVYRTESQLFYKYVNLGKPNGTILAKPYLDLIKEVILRHASWAVAKQNKITRSDWKKFRDFIGNISNNTLYQEISVLCRCSKAQAKKYVDDFVASADREIDAGDIDNSIMLQIVESNESLRRECECIVAQRWESENQEKLKAAQEELEKVRKDLEEEVGKKELIKQEFDRQTKRLEQLLVDVSQYELMGESIKAKVRYKIEEAKKDVAEFVSQIAMFAPSMTTVINTSGVQDENYYSSGAECADGEFTTYEEALESIVDELGESGVEGRYITSFAAFLFSAYANHAHLLLAGPNGESIANAFSVALFGRYAGVLDCHQKFSSQAIDEMLSGGDRVVIIKNPFSADWVTALMGLMSETDKFYLLLNPFAEDLVVEPKGLYNYVLPVFTDVVVSDMPRNGFVGKVQSSSYEKYIRQKAKPFYDEYMKTLNMSSLLAKRIQGIITDLHYLDKDADNTVDYMYIFFPYAYTVGRGAVFAQRLQNEKDIDGEKKLFMLNCLGENE